MTRRCSPWPKRSGRCWCSVPPQRDVDQLHPAADPQHGQVALDRRARQRDLERVALGHRVRPSRRARSGRRSRDRCRRRPRARARRAAPAPRRDPRPRSGSDGQHQRRARPPAAPPRRSCRAAAPPADPTRSSAPAPGPRTCRSPDAWTCSSRTRYATWPREHRIVRQAHIAARPPSGPHARVHQSSTSTAHTRGEQRR